MLNVAFYGVRGSTPVSGPDVIRYGGNTSCVVINGDEREPIVLDLGTGLRRFGAAFGPDCSFAGTALVSHLHWDHVQGLPFFAPVLRPGGRLQILGPPPDEYPDLRTAFDTFMRPPFFPVRIDDLAGHIDVDPCPSGAFRVADAQVLALAVPHAGLTYGFRISCGGVTVAYVPDHQQPVDGSHGVVDAVLELAEGVDLLIHDAQYLPHEFARKANWGHCTVDYALTVARLAGARRLALFHHDPLRNDDDLDVQATCARLVGERMGIDVFAAAEGMQFVLD